jgi:hypothetical protein
VTTTIPVVFTTGLRARGRPWSFSCPQEPGTRVGAEEPAPQVTRASVSEGGRCALASDDSEPLAGDSCQSNSGVPRIRRKRSGRPLRRLIVKDVSSEAQNTRGRVPSVAVLLDPVTAGCDTATHHRRRRSPRRPDRQSEVGRANIGQPAPPIYPSVRFRRQPSRKSCSICKKQRALPRPRCYRSPFWYVPMSSALASTCPRIARSICDFVAPLRSSVISSA